MSAFEGFKNGTLNVIGAGYTAQQPLPDDMQFQVELDRQHCERFMTLHGMITMYHYYPNNTVHEWLAENLPERYLVSGGRKVLIAFNTDVDMALFRLMFACKPYKGEVYYLKTGNLALEDFK